MTANEQPVQTDAPAADPFDLLTDADLLSVEELAEKCLREGATLADVRGYSEAELDAVYAFAHNAYQQRKYQDAVKLFYFLAENDHTDGRFWMGLGACLQMTRSYDQALAAYAVAALLDATSPEPPLRAAECYLATGKPDGARKALDAVRLVCDETGGPNAHGRVLRRVAVLASAVRAAAER